MVSPLRTWALSMLIASLLASLLDPVYAVKEELRPDQRGDPGKQLHRDIHTTTSQAGKASARDMYWADGDFGRRNISTEDAYQSALILLRSIIDPSALQNSVLYTQPSRRSPSRSKTASHPMASSLSSSNIEKEATPLEKARVTLTNLSPYLTFLTSWGPFGTMLRLSLRFKHSLYEFAHKLETFVPFAGSSGSFHGIFRGGSGRSESMRDTRRQQAWSGEQPAQVWPEWEVGGADVAVHGPFLLKEWQSGQEAIESSFLTLQIFKWLSSATFARNRTGKTGQTDTSAADNLTDALSLLEYAAYPPRPHRPSADALWVLSQHHILGTHGADPRPWLAIPHLTTLVEEVKPGNTSARSLLGWLLGSSEMWTAWGRPPTKEDWPGQSQSMALLHHTFAARDGDYTSQMALAYRNLVGIGTTPDCSEALRWYERAASQSHMRFQQGPPGGLTPPYTHLRLSDLSGGVYGPGASAASTGMAAHRPAIQAALQFLPSTNSPASTRARDPSRLDDLLAFYSYHANGGSLSHTLWLARIYYQGSIYGASESAGQVPRDYAKARELALKVTKLVWPVDVMHLRMVKGKRVTRSAGDRAGQMSEEDPILKTEGSVRSLAGSAAALLGRMYLRGEGVPADYARAWYWFWRGSEVGDKDCKYGFGLMRSLGMATDQWVRKDGKLIREGHNLDRKRAIEMWDDAAKSGIAGHAESSVALGKIHLQMGDLASAGAHFAAAVRTGSPFEGLYFLGLVNAKVYKQSLATLSPPGANDNRCQAATSFYKHAAERGDWESPVFARGVRAWELGDKKRALIYWSMAAERGDEVAQNNLAWILDRDKRRWKIPRLDGPTDTSFDRLALMYWTRSAAQDNIDALVKLGDYYYHGIGLSKATSPDANLSGSADGDSLISLGEPEYEKALACYASAADRQLSALAYWNLGHLYEAGLGVPRRDFHLAKRYYDMAVEINSEAYLPVLLSLIRLHLKALWATVWQREESAVALFSSYGNIGTGGAGGYTEAEEELLRAASREEDLDDYYFDEEGGGDLNLPESWDLRRNARGFGQQAAAVHQQQQPQRGPPGQQQQQQQQQQQGGPHPPTGAAGGELNGEADGVLMSLSEEEADAMIEGAMMVIGLSALAMLVYARQAAQARAEQERREEERRRQEVRNHIVVAEGGGQAAGEALRAQEAEWHRRDQRPGGPLYAGGLPWPPGPEVGL